MSSLYGNLKDIILMTWPTLFISLIILVSLRISYIIKHKEKFVLYKEVLLLLFVLYILCLFQVVTAQDINILEGNNFIPFREIFRYSFGSKYFIKNIIGNVVMFMPYGFFVGKYASLKNTKLTIFLLLLAVSFTIYTLLQNPLSVFIYSLLAPSLLK
jgi:glycopeptide antibiotics resistance protein